MPGASPITRPASWWRASRSVNARPARASIKPGSAALLLGCLGRVDRHPHFREPGAGLGVQAAVPSLGAEAALEGGEPDLLGGGGDAIADAGKVGEPGGMLDHPDAAAAAAQEAGGGGRPQADAGASQARPIEQLAGIGLAVGRDIGMPDDAVGWDPVARQD